ncbi:hypothetical protein [Streptomyces sp. NPDC002324]
MVTVAQQALDPGENLGDRERLGDVVLDTRNEFGNEAGQLVAGGREEEPRPVRRCHAASLGEAGAVREAGIPDHRVEPAIREPHHPFGPGDRGESSVARQLHGEQLALLPIATDHEDLVPAPAERRASSGAT